MLSLDSIDGGSNLGSGTTSGGWSSTMQMTQRYVHLLDDEKLKEAMRRYTLRA